MTEEREKSLLERLKTTIEQQKEENAELMGMIAYLTSTPLGYGTVLRLGNKNPVKRAAKIADFAKGTKVQIKAENLEAYDVKFPTGKVGELTKDGRAVVRMVESKDVLIFLDHLELQEPVYDYVDTVTLSMSGTTIEVALPKDIKDLKEGDTVLVNTMFNSIVAIAPSVQHGNTAVVKEVLPDRYCEIAEGERSRIVFSGSITEIEKGDNIVLDSGGMIIIKNNKQDTTEFTVQSKMDVQWSEIGGLQSVKDQVYEMVELPHTRPEIFKHYNKKPAKGILLFGSPGCGKTLIAKAIATTLASLYGGNLTESGFIYVKGPEILNPYVGVTEQTIRQIFERARKHKAKSGYPATIFIDEADAILSKRGSGISSDVDKTIVPMFLTEMDGLVDSAAFIILATNRADVLDPAVMRDGRINVKVMIPRPSKTATRDIAMINLKGTKVAEGMNEEIADFIATEIFKTNLKENVSGAMVAGIVDQCISEAIRRDLKGKGKPTGVTVEDVREALTKMAEREYDLHNHEKVLSNANAR